MSHDLQEIQERLAHCWTKLEGLAQLLVKTSGELVRIEDQRPRPNELILTATLVSTVPVSVRSEVGMLANELRAILDALACRLAERHSNTSKGTYFPITKEEEYFKDECKRKLRRLSPRDVDHTASFRPWRGGHETLFKLHEADRIRKHQKLLGCAGGSCANPGGRYF